MWWRRGGREFVHGFPPWVCSWVSGEIGVVVGLLGVSLGGSVMWWVVVVSCVVDGGSMGDGVVNDGLMGGDWKFWVDQWVKILIVG